MPSILERRDAEPDSGGGSGAPEGTGRSDQPIVTALIVTGVAGAPSGEPPAVPAAAMFFTTCRPSGDIVPNTV